MYKNIFLVFCLFLIFSCSGTEDNKKIETVVPSDERMAKIYKEAIEEFNDSQLYVAAQKFLEAERKSIILYNINNSTLIYIKSIH